MNERIEVEWAMDLKLYDPVSEIVPDGLSGKPDPNEWLVVRLLTGRVAELKRKGIVGWCHSSLHRGAIDKNICKAHDCLGKRCTRFEPNPVSTYLQSLEDKRRIKEKVKQQIRENKQRQSEVLDGMRRMREKWQGVLETIGSDMQIIRIEKASEQAFTVFYVSDNRFADGDRFPSFLRRLETAHPRAQIHLRHVRAPDGHFVTRDEYRTLYRK